MRQALHRTGALLFCVLISVPAIGSAAPAPLPSASYTANALQQGMERLTMDKVSRYFQAVTNLVMAAKMHPEIAGAASADASSSDAANIARITASPIAVDALRRAGLTPAQFVNVGGTLFGSMISAGMLKSNPSAKIPAGVEGENVRFIDQHSAEIQALQKRMMALVPHDASSNQ